MLAVPLAFAQENLPAPQCWLRADSAELNAAVWVDVSGNGHHAVPSTGSLLAGFSRMNFNRCFELSNGEYFSLPVGINDLRQADVIVVYETCDSTGENALWQLQIDSAKRVGQTTQRILNDNGQIIYDSTNRMKPVVNYLAQSWRTPETTSPMLTLGMADSLPLNGRIAEALYFDHRISDTAVVQWISYLAVKYGITLAQTDYLDSRRNVIWDYTNYPDYSGSIAGVGRDDSTGLYQRQTYFANGQIVMGICADAMNCVPTTIPETNEDNSAIIADGDFVMMGMQTSEGEQGGDGACTVSTLYTQSGESYEVIGQSMVQATGDVSGYNAFLRLDTSAVQNTVVPVLMIDRSGSGDYPAWATEYVYASGIDSAGYYMYNNVYWDTDLSGRDAFCFAVRMPEEEPTPRMAIADTFPLLLDSTNEREENQACLESSERGGERRRSLQRVAESQSSTYRLLPNPNHGNFTVEVEYPAEQDVTVTVYASDGKKVMVMSGKGQRSYRFEGQMVTSGHYLIDIVSDMERKTLKMVVNGK
jgi:hypothetical protein